MTHTSNSFMVNLKHFRKKKGWSLQKLADQCDTSKTYIWELENKSELDPSCKKVGLIARAFGISIDHLFHGTGDTEFDQGFLAGREHTSNLIRKAIGDLHNG